MEDEEKRQQHQHQHQHHDSMEVVEADHTVYTVKVATASAEIDLIEALSEAKSDLRQGFCYIHGDADPRANNGVLPTIVRHLLQHRKVIYWTFQNV